MPCLLLSFPSAVARDLCNAAYGAGSSVIVVKPIGFRPPHCADRSAPSSDFSLRHVSSLEVWLSGGKRLHVALPADALATKTTTLLGLTVWSWSFVKLGAQRQNAPQQLDVAFGLKLPKQFCFCITFCDDLCVERCGNLWKFRLNLLSEIKRAQLKFLSNTESLCVYSTCQTDRCDAHRTWPGPPHRRAPLHKRGGKSINL